MSTDHRQLLRASWARDRDAVLGRIGPPVGRDGAPVLAVPGAGLRASLAPRQRLRQDLLERLLRSVESEGSASLRDLATARARVRRVLEQLPSGDAAMLTPAEMAQLESDVLYEVEGLGPLGPLFADPTVSDILVNGPDEVWIDRFGRLSRTEVRFDDGEHLMRLLKRLVSSTGRHIDEASPFIDARLGDGSRLHAIIPPLSRRGAVVSIRRFRIAPFRLPELLSCDTLSPAMARFLEALVSCRINLVIAGGAAAGKTTLLNALAGFIPRSERVVTIEETAELRLDHPHVIPLEARLANTEGRGEVSLRRLVTNALRMRADRLIVGEVRGAEVFDMLQAMNAGHDGSLTTVHANSPDDALRRIENLVAMGGFGLSGDAIRELLGAAFQVIVQMARFHDGSRRITSIAEVVAHGRDLGVREIFRFAPDDSSATAAVSGRHVPTGERPVLLPLLESRGFPLVLDWPPAEGAPPPAVRNPPGTGVQ